MYICTVAVLLAFVSLQEHVQLSVEVSQKEKSKLL